MKALFPPILAALALGGAAPAVADKPPEGKSNTPSTWSYDVVDGKRVPRGKRQVNADGSWKEVIRDGDCVTIREMTSKGEYRETRQC